MISFAMVFLAIAALVSQSIKCGWMRGILAGMAVGIGLMEGFDVGAINSLSVGVFGLFVGLAGEKLSACSIGKTVLVVAVMAIFLRSRRFITSNLLAFLLIHRVCG